MWDSIFEKFSPTKSSSYQNSHNRDEVSEIKHENYNINPTFFHNLHRTIE